MPALITDKGTAFDLPILPRAELKIGLGGVQIGRALKILDELSSLLRPGLSKGPRQGVFAL
jgi:hypothetical protein